MVLHIYACAQFLTESQAAKPWTNLSLSEKYRYRADITKDNWQHLVANMSLYKNETMLSTVGFPLTIFSGCEHPSQFVFVTAADQNYFHLAVDAISNYQHFFPDKLIYFYDLSDGALDNIVDKVRMGTFMFIIITCK